MSSLYYRTNIYFENCIEDVLIESIDTDYVSESAKDFFANIIDAVVNFFKKIINNIKNKINEVKTNSKINDIKKAGIKYIEFSDDSSANTRIESSTAYVKGKFYDSREIKKIFTDLINLTHEMSKKVLNARDVSELVRIESDMDKKIKNEIDSRIDKIKPIKKGKVSLNELENALSTNQIENLRDEVINICKNMQKEAEKTFYSKIIREDVNNFNTNDTNQEGTKKLSIIKKITSKFVNCAKKIARISIHHPIATIFIISAIASGIHSIQSKSLDRTIKKTKTQIDQLKNIEKESKRMYEEYHKNYNKEVDAMLQKNRDDIDRMIKWAEKEEEKGGN